MEGLVKPSLSIPRMLITVLICACVTILWWVLGGFMLYHTDTIMQLSSGLTLWMLFIVYSYYIPKLWRFIVRYDNVEYIEYDRLVNTENI